MYMVRCLHQLLEGRSLSLPPSLPPPLSLPLPPSLSPFPLSFPPSVALSILVWVQGIKRGIVELADVIVINKADGDLLPAAQRIAGDYTSALKLSKRKSKFWKPKVEGPITIASVYIHVCMLRCMLCIRYRGRCTTIQSLVLSLKLLPLK